MMESSGSPSFLFEVAMVIIKKIKISWHKLGIPLTWDEALNLQLGHKVKCIATINEDGDDYSDIITVGKLYTIVGWDLNCWYIITDRDSRFYLHNDIGNDFKLFSKG
jgi:hypothetical protein